MQLTKYFARTAIVLLVILALLVTMMPVTADAASKPYERTTVLAAAEGDYDWRQEAGGDYFWMETDMDDGFMRLYAASSKTGTGKYLGKMGSLDNYILTNGSKVYYCKTDGFGESVAKIYSVSDKGKNRKKIATLNLRHNYDRVELEGIYDSKLYYTMYEENGLKPVLYSKALTGSKKIKKVSSSLDIIYTTGGSRYMYAATDETHNTLKVFDCKTGKAIRTIKNVNGANKCLRIYDGKLYYLKKDPDSGKFLLYSASTSGSSAKKLLTLPADSTICHPNGKYFYNAYPLKDGSMKYVRYNVKTKKKTTLSEAKFYEGLSAGAMPGIGM